MRHFRDKDLTANFTFFYVPEPEIEKANVQARVPDRSSKGFNLSKCSVVFKNLTVLVK